MRSGGRSAEFSRLAVGRLRLRKLAPSNLHIAAPGVETKTDRCAGGDILEELQRLLEPIPDKGIPGRTPEREDIVRIEFKRPLEFGLGSRPVPLALTQNPAHRKMSIR